MPYRWDPKAKRFRDPKGRFISQRNIRQLLDVAIDTKEVSLLTRAYMQGTISKDVWHQGMRKAIKKSYIQAGMLANGPLSAKDKLAMSRNVGEQYHYLDGKPDSFLDVIDDLTEKQAIARARMYVESSRKQFEEFMRDNKIELGAVWEKWVLSPKESCIGCIDLASLGMVPIGTLGTVPGKGDTPCLTSCGCRIAYYSKSKRTLRAKDVFVVLGGPGSGHHGHDGGSGGPGNPGGSQSGKSAVTFNVLGIGNLDLEGVEKELESWEGFRKQVALDGIRQEHFSESNVILQRDDGELVGVAITGLVMSHDDIAGWFDVMVESRNKYLHLNTLATKRPGYGRSIMSSVIALADTKSASIFLLSSEMAKGFYEKLGATSVGEDYYYLNEYVAYEPEDGVFVIPLPVGWDEYTELPVELVIQSLQGRAFSYFEELNMIVFDEPQGHAAVKLGGPGSGHHGHVGIPGHRGGSAPRNGLVSVVDQIVTNMAPLATSDRRERFIQDISLELPKALSLYHMSMDDVERVHVVGSFVGDKVDPGDLDIMILAKEGTQLYGRNLKGEIVPQAGSFDLTVWPQKEYIGKLGITEQDVGNVPITMVYNSSMYETMLSVFSKGTPEKPAYGPPIEVYSKDSQSLQGRAFSYFEEMNLILFDEPQGHVAVKLGGDGSGYRGHSGGRGGKGNPGGSTPRGLTVGNKTVFYTDDIHKESDMRSLISALPMSQGVRLKVIPHPKLPSGQSVSGYYDPSTKTVVVGRSPFASMIAHEVGHHVYREAKKTYGREFAGEVTANWVKLKRAVKKSPNKFAAAAKLGLSEYAARNYDEFFACFYATWTLATSEKDVLAQNFPNMATIMGDMIGA